MGDDRTFFSEMARELLHVLEPEVVAVNANKFGICIYPRSAYETKPSPWEFLQLQENQPLPADWIGFLSRLMPSLEAYKTDNSLTSKASATRSVLGLRSFLALDDVSMPTQRFARSPESRSDGRNREQEGTTTGD